VDRWPLTANGRVNLTLAL
jgi:hypothetical protein